MVGKACLKEQYTKMLKRKTGGLDLVVCPIKACEKRVSDADLRVILEDEQHLLLDAEKKWEDQDLYGDQIRCPKVGCKGIATREVLD